MPTAFLVTTSPDGLQPLGSAPQRSFELVTGAVRDRLGADHAALFAEPVASEHGDRIDWYAPMGGTARPLPDLPDSEKGALRDRLGQLVGDIRAKAEQLANSDRPEDRRLAEALTNAIEIPDDAMIHAVQDAGGSWHPVLVHWAWVRGERAAVRGILTGMVPRRGIAGADPGAPADTAAGSSGLVALWWALIVAGWVLLAAILAAIIWLLIAPCGVTWTGPGGGLARIGLFYCPDKAAPQPDIFAPGRATEDEIASLRHELALADRTCQPVVPVLPAPVETPVPKDPPSAPKPEPKPEPTSAPETDPDAHDTNADPATDGENAMARVTDRGGRRGALNFVLEWHTTDDVDLYVTCPTGETVSLNNRNACGGRYDLDANLTRTGALTDPVENVVFDAPALGLYKVRAHLRDDRPHDPIPLVLHVLREGSPDQRYTGALEHGQGGWMLNISISR